MKLSRILSAILTEILLAAIRVYGRFISPLLPPSCRYHPTCSTYARSALIAFGPFKGCWLAIKRILRCNPFSVGGYDPLPDK